MGEIIYLDGSTNPQDSIPNPPAPKVSDEYRKFVDMNSDDPHTRWGDFARCNWPDADKDMFHGPLEGREKSSDKRRRELMAKKFCGECAVREECLDWAMKENEVGIWGGLNDKERKSLKRTGRLPR